MRVGLFRPLGMASTRTLAVLALAIWALTGCQKGDPAAPGANQGPPPAEVSVARVVSKEITEWDDFTGRVEAKETIEIRPRVGGYLASVNFDEGKPVKKGQLLFAIDDREYRGNGGTQVAEYFPKLNLLGSFGSVARSGGDLFGSGTDRWRFGPSISWQFLNFGRVGQYVQAEQAKAEGAAAAYQETILRALEETEGALANFRAANESTAALSEATAQAETARALAELRFEAGASDYLVVLDAQRQRLRLDDQLIQAKTARATALAMLYKALAGDFVEAAND